MLIPSIKASAIVCVVLLSACAGKPTKESATSQSPGTTTPAAVSVDPQTSALYQQAINSMKAGRDQEALTQFQNIAAKAPQLASPYVNIGLIHLSKKRYAEAEQAFTQATTLKANDALALNHLGIALREQGKFAKAEEAYLAAVKINAEYADAHLNLGILYEIYKGDLSRALVHYEKYQALSNTKNEQISKWIADVKNRIGQQNK